jgi:hypothetical protein
MNYFETQTAKTKNLSEYAMKNRYFPVGIMVRASNSQMKSGTHKYHSYVFESTKIRKYRVEN